MGTTLPIGGTVEDPVTLGREGKKHEHLQFGSGVFAPEAEIAWSRPVRKAIASALVQATVPVSTSSRGYRAPKNFRWTAGPSFNVGRVGLGLSAAGQYQTIARWHGEIDEGTGFTRHHAEDDETFSQGTTVSLTISKAF